MPFTIYCRIDITHFFFPLAWLKALPAADFDDLLVLPSRRTVEAALAASGEVTFLGAFVCESALPAADFDFDPVEVDRRVSEELLAAAGRVTFDFSIFHTPQNKWFSPYMGRKSEINPYYMSHKLAH